MTNDADLGRRSTRRRSRDGRGSGLSADIHLLGDLLGDAIRRLAGEDAFALEEEVRAAAKALRAEPSVEEARRLRDRLDRLDLPALRTLIRAFSIYFDLINLAEQQARVRALRLRAVAGRARSRLPESPEAALRQLRERGVTAEQVAALLRRAADLPRLHRPPQRGAAPHRPGKAGGDRRASSTGSNTAACRRATATRPSPPSPTRSRRSG